MSVWSNLLNNLYPLACHYFCKTWTICLQILFPFVSICINLISSKTCIRLYQCVPSKTCIRGQRWRSRCCQRSQSASQEAGQSIAKGSFKQISSFFSGLHFQSNLSCHPTCAQILLYLSTFMRPLPSFHPGWPGKHTHRSCKASQAAGWSPL